MRRWCEKNKRTARYYAVARGFTVVEHYCYSTHGNLTHDLTWLGRRTCSDFNEISSSECLFIMPPRKVLNFQATSRTVRNNISIILCRRPPQHGCTMTDPSGSLCFSDIIVCTTENRIGANVNWESRPLTFCICIFSFFFLLLIFAESDEFWPWVNVQIVFPFPF